MVYYSVVLMSISLIIALTAFVSAILTSVMASRLHVMKWHTRIQKSKYTKFNYILSSFYQYNRQFYNPFSFLRELMLSALFTALIYKYIVYDECILSIQCIVANLLIVILIRILMQVIAYAKFFDGELVK
jgi:hypothetical protein